MVCGLFVRLVVYFASVAFLPCSCFMYLFDSCKVVKLKWELKWVTFVSIYVYGN